MFGVSLFLYVIILTLSDVISNLVNGKLLRLMNANVYYECVRVQCRIIVDYY